jgi:hypothetical protein
VLVLARGGVLRVDRNNVVHATGRSHIHRPVTFSSAATAIVRHPICPLLSYVRVLCTGWNVAVSNELGRFCCSLIYWPVCALPCRLRLLPIRCASHSHTAHVRGSQSATILRIELGPPRDSPAIIKGFQALRRTQGPLWSCITPARFST